MLYLSEILIQHQEIETFEELVALVREGKKDQRFFRMDVLPPYPDTPDNWEDILEAAFT